MIRTILYPTDLGLYGTFLLQHVMMLSEKYDAKVVAVHAVEPLGVFADAVLETYIPEDMIHDLRQFGLPAVMDAIRQQVIEGFQDEFIDLNLNPARVQDVKVIRGEPAEVIMSQAEFEKADLIVMGSQGPEREDLPVLGSTVSKVLQRSKVPVYMVPVNSTMH